MIVPTWTTNDLNPFNLLSGITHHRGWALAIVSQLGYQSNPLRHSIFHPWFNQGRWLEWPFMYPKKKKSFLHHMRHFILASHASFCLCITSINSFIAYHKNNLLILKVATVFLVSKSNHRIERYLMIKFAQSACIVSR